MANTTIAFTDKEYLIDIFGIDLFRKAKTQLEQYDFSNSDFSHPDACIYIKMSGCMDWIFDVCYYYPNKNTGRPYAKVEFTGSCG